MHKPSRPIRSALPSPPFVISTRRLTPFAAQFNIPNTYTDAHTMLATEQPDVLCFATLPAVRLPLVELGVRHGVKAIAFEKPMALSLAEARQILTLCATAGIKTDYLSPVEIWGALAKSLGDRPQWGAWRHTHATRHGAAVHAARRHAPGGHHAVVQRRAAWPLGHGAGTRHCNMPRIIPAQTISWG